MTAQEVEEIMSFKKLALAAVLAAATALPGIALATPTAKEPATCIIKGHRVTGVRALHVVERNGRGTNERLAGAEVLVQAEPGLTAEWLQLTIQRHIAEMGTTNMEDCPLDLKDVRVSVASAGPGFAVQLRAKNAAQAKEVLRRAQLLAQ